MRQPAIMDPGEYHDSHHEVANAFQKIRLDENGRVDKGPHRSVMVYHFRHDSGEQSQGGSDGADSSVGNGPGKGTDNKELSASTGKEVQKKEARKITQYFGRVSAQGGSASGGGPCSSSTGASDTEAGAGKHTDWEDMEAGVRDPHDLQHVAQHRSETP